MAFGKFNQLSREQEVKTDFPSEEKPLIVIIDDDIHISQMLALMLRKKYTVRLCPDGEDGIKNVDKSAHAVILDIKMPGKDGFQVYEELQPKFPDLPIIFFSAYQDVLEGAKLSLKYKPFNYVDKSSDIQELFDSVDRAVESYKRVLTIEKVGEKIKSKSKPIREDKDS